MCLLITSQEICQHPEEASQSLVPAKDERIDSPETAGVADSESEEPQDNSIAKDTTLDMKLVNVIPTGKKEHFINVMHMIVFRSST